MTSNYVFDAPLPAGTSLRRLAPEDRPREKLLARGPSALGVNELLAVILGAGTRSSSVLDLANRLLDRAGGLEGLSRMSAGALASLHGLKQARVAKVLVALELGRRAAAPPEQPRPAFRVPEDAGRFLLPRIGSKPLEEFGILILDTRNRLRRMEVISTGNLNGSLVHPREVFREAVALQAAALIVFHNHPFGDPTPSDEDRQLTRRLVQAGRVMGIDVLDHVIVGATRFWSFREKGEL